jgi:hypothetical protein
MAWIWDRIRGVGGNRDDQADEREEYGGQDAGAAEEQYLADSALYGSPGAQAARDDLSEFEPPRDPAP